jgi:hypothetical protein
LRGALLSLVAVGAWTQLAAQRPQPIYEGHRILGQEWCQPISVMPIKYLIEVVNGCARHLLL